MSALRMVGLAAMVVAALPAGAMAHERTATLTVSGSALVFDGLGLQQPDTEGHFAIGIRLPLPSLTAANCETPNLIVGIGTLNKPEGDLTDADRKIIARNRGYYDRLTAASRDGNQVSIPLRNSPTYLVITKGRIFAPYCTLSIDESRVP